ncbi:MAG TPA: universal stress protein [Candidatus Dormibacteraeota bacterium]|nr:universal stress protein [Candidatus Dormibacteraeota bacterium]
MFKKILVAIGGSEDASETVPVVVGLAKALDSDVLVIHMRERIVTSVATLEAETIPESFQFGEEIVRQLVKAGVKARSDIDSARPEHLAAFILAKADEFGADLIVVGSHHAHGLRDRMFGDIGKALAHGSRCPLLLMPSSLE